MILEKDKAFMEKRQSVIQHMKEGNHMFYSSMQELLKYVSTQFLRTVKIEDKYLRDKRDKVLNEGSYAISAIKLVCAVIKQTSLYEAINMSLMNTLANSSKHSTLVFPYAEHYGEDIVSTYNDYIEGMWNSVEGENSIFSKNCYIEFENITKEKVNAEQPNLENIETKENSIEMSPTAKGYIDGTVSEVMLSVVYDTLSDYDKTQIMMHLADKFDKKFKEGKKLIVNMGGNDWFVYLKETKDYSMYLYAGAGLIRKNGNGNTISMSYRGNEYSRTLNIGEFYSTLLTWIPKEKYEGVFKAVDYKGLRFSKDNYVSFYTKDEKLQNVCVCEFEG